MVSARRIKKHTGALKGRLDVSEDFDAPLPEVESLFGAMACSVLLEGDSVSPVGDDQDTEGFS